MYMKCTTQFSLIKRENSQRDQEGGGKYIMVMVEIDSNAILVKPLKSRNDADLT